MFGAEKGLRRIAMQRSSATNSQTDLSTTSTELQIACIRETLLTLMKLVVYVISLVGCLTWWRRSIMKNQLNYRTSASESFKEVSQRLSIASVHALLTFIDPLLLVALLVVMCTASGRYKMGDVHDC